jgi:hypothetical protein
VTGKPIQSQVPDPDPSVSPSEGDVPALTVTKDISFDLSEYVGTVHLRVEVGDLLVMDGQVDTSIGTWTGTVSHSGSQQVDYYVDDELVKSETIDFAS